jgi:hypothetical protein
MKLFLTIMMFISVTAFAQTAAIKDIPADGEDTTISITKGKKGQVEFQIEEGKAEIAGDPEILAKAARDSWKKECADWKKEVKELNKDNQVMALSCNNPSCAKTEMSQTVCQSTGTYKVKTKVR